MPLTVFIAALIALAGIWVASLRIDATLPPPGPQNTPEQNVTGCGVNLLLAVLALLLLAAIVAASFNEF